MAKTLENRICKPCTNLCWDCFCSLCINALGAKAWMHFCQSSNNLDYHTSPVKIHLSTEKHINIRAPQGVCRNKRNKTNVFNQQQQCRFDRKKKETKLALKNKEIDWCFQSILTTNYNVISKRETY